MEILYLAIGIVVGSLIAVVIMRSKLKAKVLETIGEKEKEVALNKEGYAKLETDYAIMKSSLDDKQQILDNNIIKLESESNLRQNAEIKVAELLNEKKNLEGIKTNLTVSVSELENKLEIEYKNRRQAETNLTELGTEKESILEKLDYERVKLLEIEKKFSVEFENLANKILKQNTLEFSTTSSKSISDLLDPLKDKIQSFEKKVENTYEKGLKDQLDLKSELKRLHELSMRLDQDARNLTNALKSDTKKQGNWGEIILERVLERSGLVKDQEYFVQQTARNDDGDMLRPDVVVKLPDNKHIIIDSKVSLTAYTAFVSEDDDRKREVALKLHLTSVKKHIKELSDKSYESLAAFNSPDFVLMFMPIEPAFALAVQSDPELFNYAWKERVVIVSPTTLLATLRTVASIWKYEKQNLNALEIAERGGKLYDKFESFIKDLESVGVNIQRAGKSYDEAHKKLTSGSGNILKQVEHLKKMGVSTKKSLPEQYLIDNE